MQQLSLPQCFLLSYCLRDGARLLQVHRGQSTLKHARQPSVSCDQGMQPFDNEGMAAASREVFGGRGLTDCATPMAKRLQVAVRSEWLFDDVAEVTILEPDTKGTTGRGAKTGRQICGTHELNQTEAST